MRACDNDPKKRQVVGQRPTSVPSMVALSQSVAELSCGHRHVTHMHRTEFSALPIARDRHPLPAAAAHQLTVPRVRLSITCLRFCRSKFLKGVNHFSIQFTVVENDDFWPLSKFKYRLTPLRGVLSVNKKQTYKHHIFAPPAGARCTIFPKLCTVIEHVEIIKKKLIIFRSNVQFFLQGARKNSA